METKQIPFDLETVKKIQAGEIKGIIRTRDGRPARFLGKIDNEKFPLIFAHSQYCDNQERAFHHTINGSFFLDTKQGNRDIIIEIEEPKQEHKFKPFDKVLVRDEDNGYCIWQAAFYSHFYIYRDNGYHVTTAGDFYLDGEIIPYAGNENLLGTNNKQKED